MRLLPAALTVLLLLVADQLSKAAITAHFAYGESVPVIPGFFNLVLVYNPGAAFSFLSGESGWQRWFFIGITIAAVALIMWMIHRHRSDKLFCWGLTLILGGAVGNLVDRIRLGHVIDFLDFVFGNWHFWAFNVADSAITVGAALLILDSFRPRRS
ncbi:MAG: lipoprotein signal peptidase [Betaproteobacteria bacterium]|nr:lipoprotein signal peptidase [Betaproteobacteria bacterium]